MQTLLLPEAALVSLTSQRTRLCDGMFSHKRRDDCYKHDELCRFQASRKKFKKERLIQLTAGGEGETAEHVLAVQM